MDALSCGWEKCSRAPDAAQRAALAISAFTRVFDALWCAAEPGPYQAPVFGTVPALRSGMKNAAPRPGHGVSCGWANPGAQPADDATGEEIYAEDKQQAEPQQPAIRMQQARQQRQSGVGGCVRCHAHQRLQII